MLLAMNYKRRNNIVTNNNKIATNNNKMDEEQIQLLLSFSGFQGTQTLSKMRRDLRKCCPANIKTTFTYESTKPCPSI